MEKGKRIIPLTIGIVLLLIMATSSLGYAEEVIPSFFGESKIENNNLNEAKIEKIEKENVKKQSKTIIKESKEKNQKVISKDEAEKIGKEVLKEYCKIDISDTIPIKTSDLTDGYYEITLGNESGKNKVKIDRYGNIINVYTPVIKSSISRIYDINVNKARSLVDRFLKEYSKTGVDNIEILLTNNKELGSNILEYKIQRVHNNIDVLEEGGRISIDGENLRVVNFNITWSNINFEEEEGIKLNKKEAINILKESNKVNPIYISNGEKYILDFSLKENEEYTIDVGKRELKDFLQSEYIVKKNVSKGISNLDSNAKTKEEIGNISVDIVSKLTKKRGRSLPISEIDENGKSLIRNVVVLDSGERYYLEYDSKTFKVVNIYKYGHDTKELKKFEPIKFKKAYETAVTTIGLVYNEELKKLSLKQKEYALLNSRVYSFTFNREEKKVVVDDQHVSVSVDAITGEVLSVFLNWNSASEFDDSNKKKVEEKREKYLKSLQGKHTYINENGIGKLYYILKNK